jgi:hypothetical protein
MNKTKNTDIVDNFIFCLYYFVRFIIKIFIWNKEEKCTLNPHSPYSIPHDYLLISSSKKYHTNRYNNLIVTTEYKCSKCSEVYRVINASTSKLIDDYKHHSTLENNEYRAFVTPEKGWKIIKLINIDKSLGLSQIMNPDGTIETLTNEYIVSNTAKEYYDWKGTNERIFQKQRQEMKDNTFYVVC